MTPVGISLSTKDLLTIFHWRSWETNSTSFSLNFFLPKNLLAPDPFVCRIIYLNFFSRTYFFNIHSLIGPKLDRVFYYFYHVYAHLLCLLILRLLRFMNPFLHFMQFDLIWNWKSPIIQSYDDTVTVLNPECCMSIF